MHFRDLLFRDGRSVQGAANRRAVLAGLALPQWSLRGCQRVSLQRQLLCSRPAGVLRGHDLARAPATHPRVVEQVAADRRTVNQSSRVAPQNRGA